ncbi:MAG: nucleotidyltransferase [Bdellovibrionota bacterium]|nr:nucleotidyltransferase [Bdellovibrionota bacterium]
MLNKEQKNKILEEMLGKLELPDSAYEKAKSRYDDLGEWLGRDGSILKDNNPHVFPQGSFRLGTAIRPLDDKEEYDLDLSCKLREGVTTSSHSQRQIKNMVKEELESYRKARGIKEDVK